MINLFSVTTWKNPKILKNIPLSRACCYFCFYLLCQWWWFSLHFFSCQRSWSAWYESNSISVKVGPCHTFFKGDYFISFFPPESRLSQKSFLSYFLSGLRTFPGASLPWNWNPLNVPTLFRWLVSTLHVWILKSCLYFLALPLAIKIPGDFGTINNLALWQL